RHTRFSRDWSSDVCSSDLCVGERQQGVDRIGGGSTPAARELPGGSNQPGEGVVVSRGGRSLYTTQCVEGGGRRQAVPAFPDPFHGLGQGAPQVCSPAPVACKCTILGDELAVQDLARRFQASIVVSYPAVLSHPSGCVSVARPAANPGGVVAAGIRH